MTASHRERFCFCLSFSIKQVERRQAPGTLSETLIRRVQLRRRCTEAVTDEQYRCRTHRIRRCRPRQTSRLRLKSSKLARTEFTLAGGKGADAGELRPLEGQERRHVVPVPTLVAKGAAAVPHNLMADVGRRLALRIAFLRWRSREALYIVTDHH